MCEWEGTRITGSEAREIDLELMNPEKYAFSVDQLMEIAGLSTAQVVSECYPNLPGRERKCILVCSGPGNNGGDGLVCTRHLIQLGYDVKVYYPKEGKTRICQILLAQLKRQKVKILTELNEDILKKVNVLVDAILGVGSSGELREPFLNAVKMINKYCKEIVSIDVPSGWDVDKGKIYTHCIERPSVLVSIMLPKKYIDVGRHEISSRKIKHFIAGRFLPLQIIQERKLLPPMYPDNKQYFQAPDV